MYKEIELDWSHQISEPMITLVCASGITLTEEILEFLGYTGIRMDSGPIFGRSRKVRVAKVYNILKIET